MLKMARTVGLQMQNESETEKKDAPSRTPTFVDFNGNRKQKDRVEIPDPRAAALGVILSKKLYQGTLPSQHLVL